MSQRVNPYRAAPGAMKAMLELEKQVSGLGLEKSLVELVKIRASQINGCAYCLKLHSADARKAGETEERLYLLSAWREAGIYSDREKAALSWTESLTLLPGKQASDADYQFLSAHFTEPEQVELTLLITTINAWNRFAVAFRYSLGGPGRG